jgi:putative methyltransferase (TIGR04325 family)
LASDLAPTLKSVVRLLTPQPLLSARYKRHFFQSRRWENLHLGVFESFHAAREFATRWGVASRFELDHEAWLKDRMRLRCHDYPMMFWLERALEKDTRVVDLGGSVGVSWYAFKPFISFPAGLQWQVCELENVLPIGRRIAQDRGESALSFTSDFGSIDGASVLFTAGAIQYIDTTLAQLLAGLKSPPMHLLINRLPLTTVKACMPTGSPMQASSSMTSGVWDIDKSIDGNASRTRLRFPCTPNSP